MNLQIKGAVGLDAEGIRGEIDRGGRLVIFTYCVSLVVLTFKRPTGIHLIRVGQGTLFTSLPYSLLSLLLGWWGIPWGPIYTIQTLYENLAGGTDVTDEVMAALAPPPARTAGSAAARPPAVAPGPERPSRRFSPVAALLSVGAIAALVTTGVTVYCWHAGQNQDIVVVNGLDRAYSFSLGGETMTLMPHGTLRLERPQGRFELRPGPDSGFIDPATLDFEVPFLSRLTDARVAVVNPDCTAIIYVEDVVYRATANPADDAPTNFTLLVNQPAHFIAEPDFVLAPAPTSVALPKRSGQVTKTRLDYARPVPIEAGLRVVREKFGEEGVREHLRRQARARADEPLLEAVRQELPAAEALALLRTRLAERPLLLEWHRYYQQLAERAEPDTDLLAEYDAALRSDPANADLLYLRGRVDPEPESARTFYRQAVAGAQPCLYGWVGLSYDSLCRGDYETALADIERARSGGLDSESLRYNRRLVLLSLGREADLLNENRESQKAMPHDFRLVREECLLRASAGERDLDGRLTAYVESLGEPLPAENRRLLEQAGRLAAALGRGDEAAYLSILTELPDPGSRFNAAISANRVSEAAACLEEFAAGDRHSVYQFLLFIAAGQGADAAVADRFYSDAVASLAAEGRDERRLAALLAGSTPPDPAAIAAASIYPVQKRVIACALGLRHPGLQQQYFDLARRLNFDPEFPRLYLRRVMDQSLAPL